MSQGAGEDRVMDHDAGERDERMQKACEVLKETGIAPLQKRLYMHIMHTLIFQCILIQFFALHTDKLTP